MKGMVLIDVCRNNYNNPAIFFKYNVYKYENNIDGLLDCCRAPSDSQISPSPSPGLSVKSNQYLYQTGMGLYHSHGYPQLLHWSTLFCRQISYSDVKICAWFEIKQIYLYFLYLNIC